MDRVEFNVMTGLSTLVTLTPEEESAALARQAAIDADNTQDKRAARAVDSIDLLQFAHLFLLENEKRDIKATLNQLLIAGGLPAKYSAADTAQITQAQYRTALINRWKTLFP